MSLFFKKNDTIALSSVVGLQSGTVVRCYLYKIGVE
jgi:hypothetical protein